MKTNRTLKKNMGGLLLQKQKAKESFFKKYHFTVGLLVFRIKFIIYALLLVFKVWKML
jgi:hypothetical protein